MYLRRFVHIRWGRTSHNEHAIMLALILVVCIASVRMIGPDPADTRPFWDRVLASLLGLAQCFGLVVGVAVVLASAEMFKQALARLALRRNEQKLGFLEPLIRDANQAPPDGLARVLRLLSDGNDQVRQRALAATYTLLRAHPELPLTAAQQQGILRALLASPGFVRTLAEVPADGQLLSAVTLGAKLGAGSSDKRLGPVTTDPAELAHWVEVHRKDKSHHEIQVSIGHDTGNFPGLAERSRFLALYLFISTTELKHFQALVRRPPRDPNAALGLVIRGDVVEVCCPGQARGHRLDYVFPLPVRLAECNLAGLIRQIQVLNLGLLIACAHDATSVLLRHEDFAGLDSCRRSAGQAYRVFERQFLRVLRRFDTCRDPDQIHLTRSCDHQERVHAFQTYRLEECLYPNYSWVVPLYDPDTRWERLLTPLRAIEGMLLHQGESSTGDRTVGLEFIHEVRKLGYESAHAIEQALAGASSLATPLLPDPFLDPAEPEAVRRYLSRVSQALQRGQIAREDLIDPATFLGAAAFHGIDLASINPDPSPPESDHEPHLEPPA